MRCLHSLGAAQPAAAEASGGGVDVLIRSDAIAQAVIRCTEQLSNRILKVTGVQVEHGLRPISVEAKGSVGRVVSTDRPINHDPGVGDPSIPHPPLTGGPGPPDRFYNGARLWQVDQVFPKAFRTGEDAAAEGYIRSASHSSAGEVVYLTDGDDIAGVYGTITKWTDVRDGAMRFHPGGMVLGIDANRIVVNPMLEEGHSAANFVEGVSDRVFTTPGRVDTSKIVSVKFESYDNIMSNPEATLVADGFPGFEGMSAEALRNPAAVNARLTDMAEAVRRNYPDIDVSVGSSPLTADEAIRTFLAT